MSQPLLSLCMIVRDSAATLPACLASIRPWVDELIVVDTGSLDNTREIARRFGAQVFEFPWIDDFAAARNESLKHATGQWLFWMDSDDTIDEENGRQLRELAYGRHPDHILGYVIQVHCPAPAMDSGDEMTVVDHVKLIRNHPEIRFEGRIHEQVIPAIRRLGGEVAWTDLFVVHSGAEHSPEAKQRKYERDLRILQKDLAERPNHPFVLFNLGMTYDDMGQHQEAENWLRQCLAVSDPRESHVRKVYALLACSLDRQGRPHEAHEVCRHGLTLFPEDEELLFRLGILEHRAKNYEAAIRAFRSVLNHQGERHFTSVDRGITGYKARHNLALVYEDAGRLDLAELQWRLILGEAPHYSPARHSLQRLFGEQQRSMTIHEFADRRTPVGDASKGSRPLPQPSSDATGQFETGRAKDETMDCQDSFPPNDLPVCASRRPYSPAKGVYFCAHPGVHTRNNLVTADFCRVCPKCSTQEPAEFRPYLPILTLDRGQPCLFLGKQTGLRECRACRGKVSVKVFACGHPDHEEVTLTDCERCLDYERPLGAVSTTDWRVAVVGNSDHLDSIRIATETLTRQGWENISVFLDGHPKSSSRPMDESWDYRTANLGEFPRFYLALAEMYQRFPRAGGYLLVCRPLNDTFPRRQILEQILWPAPNTGFVGLGHGEVSGSLTLKPAHGARDFQCLSLCIFPNFAARSFLADRSVIIHRLRGDDAGVGMLDVALSDWVGRAGLPAFVVRQPLGTLAPRAEHDSSFQAAQLLVAERLESCVERPVPKE